MENQKENHKYLETNGDYRMRELDKSDLEQFNALLQYAFQVTSYELLQTGWEQDEIKYAKRPILEAAYVLGWFYREKLASMIVVYSMNHRCCHLSGIYGQGAHTLPDEAGHQLYARSGIPHIIPVSLLDSLLS